MKKEGKNEIPSTLICRSCAAATLCARHDARLTMTTARFGLGEKRRWHKKGEKSSQLFPFFQFSILCIFSISLHCCLIPPHTPRCRKQNEKLLSFFSLLSFSPSEEKKKKRDVFSPFTHFAAGLCARLSFLFHFSFTSIQFAEEEEQWRDEKMMGEEERKKERKKV